MDVSLINLIVIGITVGLSLGLLGLIWRLVPGYVERVLLALDRRIPADLSTFVQPTSRSIGAALALIVVIPAAFTVASQLGADLSNVLDSAADGGKGAGKWAWDRAWRIAIIVIVIWTANRAATHLMAPLVKRLLTRRADAAEHLEEVEKRARTLEGVLAKTVSVFLVTIAVFMILAELGINIAPLLAGAGVVGIAIGFGAQSLVRDIISGIFILLEDQYRVGDVARVAGVAGLVEDINLRRTTLRDLDFIQHIIPNGEIRVASNFTKEKSRVNINISVAYKEDLDRVMEVIARVGQEMSDDPEYGPLITDPLKPLRVDAFEDSGIAIKVLGETKPIQQWTVAGEFRRRIKRAFDEEGIEIPFPHRTLYWGVGEETRVRRLLDIREEENRRIEEEEKAVQTDHGSGEE